MSTYVKRAMVTLLPEWGPTLDKLKKEQFYNDSQAEMLRYIIGIGLKSLDISGSEQLEKSLEDIEIDTNRDIHN